MHDITQNRSSAALGESYKALLEICGEDAMKNVVIATNMWTMHDPNRMAREKGRERELRYGDPCYKNAFDRGASLARHDNTAESSSVILQQLLRKEPVVLQCQIPGDRHRGEHKQSVYTASESTHVDSVYSAKDQPEPRCGGCLSLPIRRKKTA
ncbi:uncharacterized protein C8Q71DRAFT_221249 [Rhodofomes roseus]|uniref:Uncharacterized protein n=1 Tax=Rhodofomes roseus TaxID=34475 RepID=A0ABQ8KVF6_9APHY|nr:uncharacterized protein C8Q71DRAFT_221249 [Rhodofomes roseus]KAH9842791.1 hypothetical protein C8Q71DRAFT_221249 [Rhodofomes roseus]